MVRTSGREFYCFYGKIPIFVSKSYKLNWFGSKFWNFLRRDVIKSGFMPFRLFGAAPQFNEYGKDSEKLQVIFASPAVLKVFVLQCDLFSLAKVYVYDSNNEIVPDDPAIARFENPNYMQQRAQFLWDYMFWKMVGNAYCYLTSKLVDRENAPMHWLDISKIDWPLELEKQKDKLILSPAAYNELMRQQVTYRYEDGTSIKIPLKDLAMITDLTNGNGNWFKGNSRLDALYKFVANSEASLDSKNINIRYTGKFMVSGTQDPADVTKTPMSEPERKSIETRVNDEDRQVYGMKSLIEIKRFVDDIRVMPLDEAYLADYYFIGSMYNIPKDILEAHAKGATYENQEKSMGRHVGYTLEPAGEALGAAIGKQWGYPELKKRIVLSWDHLPFTQVMEKDRAATKQTIATAFTNLLRAGVPEDQINIFLDTEFKGSKLPEPKKPVI